MLEVEQDQQAGQQPKPYLGTTISLFRLNRNGYKAMIDYMNKE